MPMRETCSRPNVASPCVDAGMKSTLSLGPAAKPSRLTNSCTTSFLTCRAPVKCKPAVAAGACAAPSEEADLLHHRDLVPLLPPLAHLAVLEMIDDQPSEVDLLVGGRPGTERAAMRAGAAPAHGDLVAVGEVVLDLDV